MERDTAGLVVRTPAKVNLFLEVLGKRSDGYHEIVTLMTAIDLDDTLEFREEESGSIALSCDHPTLTTGSDNLIVRAARLLQQRTGCGRGANIRLMKRIPLAAGLAGGSSDAAATLAGLNSLWQLRLSQKELAELGAELGSDIPFFFSLPAAWCTGRGEKVTPLRPACPLHFVLCCPQEGLSTAEVYRNVCIPEQPVSGDELSLALREGDSSHVGRLLHNRLQSAAEKLCPTVAEYHRRLAALQPLGVLMSGSGSSVFALCRDPGDALRVARGLTPGTGKGGSEGHPRVFLARSLDSFGVS